MIFGKDLRYDVSELEWEKQMHKYWHRMFCRAMFVIGFLGWPYIVAIIKVISIKIGL